MDKIFLIFGLMLSVALPAAAQSDLQKLIETERTFAALAAEKGTRTAFLANAADDGVLFLPEKINAKQYWTARQESKGLLSWAPNYADVSSNGAIGYTTGNWEFRPSGKGDNPTGFGDFITIWQRMPDGRYKFIVDIGVGHDKPAAYSEVTAPPSYPQDANAKGTSAADTASKFFEVVGSAGLHSAYKVYAAEKIRSYREGLPPMLGKSALLDHIKKRKTSTTLTKRSVFFGAADLAYITNTYSQILPDGKTERGNFLQIWKLIDGRWQIVLDIFKPVPEKT
jgi:ketosteroid isomerase-like protein